MDNLELIFAQKIRILSLKRKVVELWGELSTMKSIMKHDYNLLKERLEAAEQRNAALSSLLLRMASKGSEIPGFPAALMREARLLIQPSESGASE
jgi:hypothetical protein